jgi:hypothetical protein
MDASKNRVVVMCIIVSIMNKGFVCSTTTTRRPRPDAYDQTPTNCGRPAPICGPNCAEAELESFRKMAPSPAKWSKDQRWRPKSGGQTAVKNQAGALAVRASGLQALSSVPFLSLVKQYWSNIAVKRGRAP